MNKAELFLNKILEINKEQSDILTQRNKSYKMGFERHSEILKILFKDKNEKFIKNFIHSERFFFINMIIMKIVRYCDNLENGHKDSILDLANYATLLAAFDDTNPEINNKL